MFGGRQGVVEKDEIEQTLPVRRLANHLPLTGQVKRVIDIFPCLEYLRFVVA